MHISLLDIIIRYHHIYLVRYYSGSSGQSLQPQGYRLHGLQPQHIFQTYSYDHIIRKKYVSLYIVLLSQTKNIDFESLPSMRKENPNLLPVLTASEQRTLTDLRQVILSDIFSYLMIKLID
jgi:hypothetical protein